MDLTIPCKRKPSPGPLLSEDIIDLTETSSPHQFICEPEDKNSDTMAEYAGEGTDKNRFRDIVRFKQSGAYPQKIIDNPAKKFTRKKIRDFLMTADNYEISSVEMSSLSKSKLCYKFDKFKNLRVIPFKHELQHILKNIHVENGKHLGISTMRERIKVLKLYWPGHSFDIESYMKNCLCNAIINKPIFHRPNQ